MAAPSQGSYLTPAGHIMPAYSGRGRPPLNPQQQPQQHGQVVSELFMNSKNELSITNLLTLFDIFSATCATAALDSSSTK